MDKAQEILKQMPDVKIGIDSFYGQQTVLNALNKALNIPPVINSLPTREALEDKNELCNSWGNTSHPDECYGQGLEDMYDAMLKVMT